MRGWYRLDALSHEQIDFAVIVGVDKNGMPFISKIGDVTEFKLAGCKEILDTVVKEVFESMLQQTNDEDGYNDELDEDEEEDDWS